MSSSWSIKELTTFKPLCQKFDLLGSNLKGFNNAVSWRTKFLRAMDHKEVIYGKESISDIHLGVDTEEELELAREVASSL